MYRGTYPHMCMRYVHLQKRVAVYATAKDVLRDFGRPISSANLNEIQALKGIGQKTFEKVKEYVNTGRYAADSGVYMYVCIYVCIYVCL